MPETGLDLGWYYNSRSYGLYLHQRAVPLAIQTRVVLLLYYPAFRQSAIVVDVTLGQYTGPSCRLEGLRRLGCFRLRLIFKDVLLRMSTLRTQPPILGCCDIPHVYALFICHSNAGQQLVCRVVTASFHFFCPPFRASGLPTPKCLCFQTR